MQRRNFIHTVGLFGLLGTGCKPVSRSTFMNKAELKLSLAQWSLNKAIFSKQIDAIDFPEIAQRDFGISAVEYVNQFYINHATDDRYWQDLHQRCDDLGVTSLLIMVDDEGDLGDPNQSNRVNAVQNHEKWLNNAKLLGCHSIRVNAFSEAGKDVARSALVDGLGRLSELASASGIHVLIENHGLFSSDADLVVEIINEVDNPFLGTLPDFGNWCTTAKWGSTRLGDCEQVYDMYNGVNAFLPYAKGVSAKSYDFDAAGNQEIIDYRRMLEIVRTSGYTGYIGIEYEGENLGEWEGIRATKKLIQRIWNELD